MHALRREEGVLACGGPLVVDTGRHTGRAAEDKFVVREPGSEDRIWWGKVNQPIDEAHFEGLRAKVASYLGEGPRGRPRYDSTQAHRAGPPGSILSGYPTKNCFFAPTRRSRFAAARSAADRDRRRPRPPLPSVRS